jgi:hypothetical protein
MVSVTARQVSIHDDNSRTSDVPSFERRPLTMSACSIQKAIGALTTVFRGIDTLAVSGGIFEFAPFVCAPNGLAAPPAGRAKDVPL